MGVKFVDEALPVEPRVEAYAARVVEELQAGFGVGREVEFRVVERLDEAVVGAAVEVAEDEVDLGREGDAGAEVGQQMDVVARGFAAPNGDVVIGKGGVTVGAPEPQRVHAGLDGDAFGGPVDGLGLQPEAGQGVALGGVGGALDVAEEVEVVHLEREAAQFVLSEA